MPEVSRARCALLSRRRALAAPALVTATFPRAAGALSMPPPDPWAFSPDVRDIKVNASVLVRSGPGQRWRVLQSGQPTIGGATPHLEPGGILRPELGDGLRRRAAEVAATTLRRHSGMRQYYAGRMPAEPPPLPRVIFPESRITHTEEDRRGRLSVNATLFVQDITDELPERPRPAVRFLAILDSASQSRLLPSGHRTRDLLPRLTHHSVMPGTIEEQLLRRLDGVIERAILFAGWEDLG